MLFSSPSSCPSLSLSIYLSLSLSLSPLFSLFLPRPCHPPLSPCVDVFKTSDKTDVESSTNLRPRQACGACGLTLASEHTRVAMVVSPLSPSLSPRQSSIQSKASLGVVGGEKEAYFQVRRGGSYLVGRCAREHRLKDACHVDPCPPGEFGATLDWNPLLLKNHRGHGEPNSGSPPRQLDDIII